MHLDLSDNNISLQVISLSIQQINKIKGDGNDSNFAHLSSLQVPKMLSTF
jgi:hypothetical protein